MSGSPAALAEGSSARSFILQRVFNMASVSADIRLPTPRYGQRGDRISRRCAPAPCRGSLPGKRSALQATYDRRQQLEPICWHGSRDHAGCDRAEVTPLVQCSSVGCDRILVPWPTKSTYGTPPKHRSFLRDFCGRGRDCGGHILGSIPIGDGHRSERDRSPRSGGHVRKSPRRPRKSGRTAAYTSGSASMARLPR